jgi:hypothetical protein
MADDGAFLGMTLIELHKIKFIVIVIMLTCYKSNVKTRIQKNIPRQRDAGKRICPQAQAAWPGGQLIYIVRGVLWKEFRRLLSDF